MTVASLTDVLTPAFDEGYGLAGLVVLGWEDACAFVAAAEELRCPVILQAGPGVSGTYTCICSGADVPLIGRTGTSARGLSY